MRAADGDMLARQLVDVALLPEGGVDGAPRLLTVAQERRVPGTSRLTVMERVAGRWAVRTETEDAPPILKATRTPWLVALDERRFALLAVAPDLGETWIRTVRWSGEQLQLGRRRAVPLLADVAGTADVDGDGTSELVVGEATTRRGGPTCQGSRLAVLDLPTMATRATHDIPNLRLAAGAVGPLDGEPGDDLFATAFRNCPAGPASAYRLATTVVRLSDGQVVLDRPLAAADLMTAWSGRPVVTDLDGDGTAEGLVGSRDGLVTVDLARDRRTQPLTMLPGILEGAIPLAGGGALVATRSSDSIVLGLVSASPDGPRAAVTTVLGSDRIGMRRWEAATVDGRSAALRFRGGPAWIDRSAGCPTLVVASAIVDCGSRRFESGRSALPGPAWLGVRPIAALEGHPDRSILVARSVAPVGAPGRFGAPGPLAVEPAGAAWRHGPSAPFTLAEVPATQLWAATPAVEVAPNTVAGPAMAVDVAPGARVLADVVPPLDPAARTRLGPLLNGSGAQAAGMQLLDHDGEGPLHVRLPTDPTAPTETPAWDAVVIAISPLGDISEPVRARIVRDILAPGVTVDAPVATVPWPFTATVRGRSEPGSSVTVDGRPVHVAPDGQFEVDARLPPWPQRLRVEAVDRAGNSQAIEAELVGGFDYRQLPWVAILVGTLVAGGLVSVLRASGRSTLRQSSAWDDVPAPPIEEITTAEPTTRVHDPGPAR